MGVVENDRIPSGGLLPHNETHRQGLQTGRSGAHDWNPQSAAATGCGGMWMMDGDVLLPQFGTCIVMWQFSSRNPGRSRVIRVFGREWFGRCQGIWLHC